MAKKHPYEVKVPLRNPNAEKLIRFDWVKDQYGGDDSRFHTQACGNYVMYYFDNEEIAVEFALRFA